MAQSAMMEMRVLTVNEVDEVSGDFFRDALEAFGGGYLGYEYALVGAESPTQNAT